MGFITAAVIGLALAATGMSIASATKKPKMPQQPELPKMPTMKDASTQAQESIKKRQQAMARSQTTFTSPLGVTDEADIAKKTLLGG